MTTDSTFTTKTGRITGTLHMRRFTDSATNTDQELPTKRVEERASRNSALLQRTQKRVVLGRA